MIEATLNLPSIPGGKKLIYNQHDLLSYAHYEFARMGEVIRYSRKLAEIRLRKEFRTLECRGRKLSFGELQKSLKTIIPV